MATDHLKDYNGTQENTSRKYLHATRKGRMKFFKYSVKMGRALLTENEEVIKSVPKKRWEEDELHKEMRKTL